MHSSLRDIGETVSLDLYRSTETHSYLRNHRDALLVSTGEDLREWTYYVKSEAEFTARLNYALAGVPAFPIEIHAASDPDWDMFERFKAGIKE
ncbi:MAG TPA: DUF695 domain-containing protein [Blastocatellia bacterium]|nr:DUF695 domain-containing protein [Blastocatellia bacterium]